MPVASRLVVVKHLRGRLHHGGLTYKEVGMKVYTVQISKRRLAETVGGVFIDTSIKSGSSSGFAPTWDIVRAVKSGAITTQEYQKVYHILMRDSYMNQREKWVEAVQCDVVVFGCYCKAGDFCHRKLLVWYFEVLARANNIPFEYMGELQ